MNKKNCNITFEVLHQLIHLKIHHHGHKPFDTMMIDPKSSSCAEIHEKQMNILIKECVYVHYKESFVSCYK